MEDDKRPVACRSCASRAGELLLDLGPQPDPDMLLDRVDATAPVAAVRVWLCASCSLVQLIGPRPARSTGVHGHAGGGPPGEREPWWAELDRRIPSGHPLVVDVDVADPGIGEGFRAAGFPVVGFRAGAGDDAMRYPWIRDAAFGAAAAPIVERRPARAGLVVVSHALAHSDDPQGLVAAIEAVLAPDGLVAIEAHHVLGLAGGQFDVLSHAHRSYFSLAALESLLERHGLAVESAATTDRFGGTLRIVARRARDLTGNGARDRSVDTVRRLERDADLAQPSGYADLPRQVAEAADGLRAFLDRAAGDGRRVAGYGAAARGTALLNIAGIGSDLLPFIADRSPAKQGRLLPGAMIPIRPPESINLDRPDVILILPWPLAGEVMGQLSAARAWGAQFAVAIPRLAVFQ